MTDFYNYILNMKKCYVLFLIVLKYTKLLDKIGNYELESNYKLSNTVNHQIISNL
jgi:hypothetical protein